MGGFRKIKVPKYKTKGLIKKMKARKKRKTKIVFKKGDPFTGQLFK